MNVVYKIIDIDNNKIYIGSTVNFNKRKRVHLNMLSRNVHYNNYLQDRYNNFGIDNFKFEIIESFDSCTRKYLYSIEDKYMELLKSRDIEFGYNIAPAHGGNIISHLPPIQYNELCKMQSINTKTRWENYSDEHKMNISENVCGSKNPNYKHEIANKLCDICNKEFRSTKKYCSKSCYVISLSTNRVKEKNSFFGKQHSEETKNKLRLNRLGTNPITSQNKFFYIDNVMYTSLGQASKMLNIHITTIRHRLNSNNKKFRGYMYCPKIIGEVAI